MLIKVQAQAGSSGLQTLPLQSGIQKLAAYKHPQKNNCAGYWDSTLQGTPLYLIYATLNKVQAFTPVTRHFMYKVQFFALSSDSVTTWLPQGNGIVS